MSFSTLKIFILTLFSVSALFSSSQWSIETIDKSKTFRSLTDRSLAIDSNGVKHMAYGQNGLFYSWKEDTSPFSPFFTINIDPANGVGEDAAICVDSNNVVHISYYDSINGNLKYATNKSGIWSISVIDSIGDVGTNSSITVASDNTIHIAYQDNSNGDLKYASYESGSWGVRKTFSGAIADNTSIAVDNTGNIHIGYEKAGELRYVSKISGTWHSDAFVANGTFSSMALDSSGTVHFSFTDNSTMHLMYSSKESNGSWTIEDIGIVGAYSSLVINSDDTAYITFAKQSGYISYAKKVPGGTWSITDIAYGVDFDGYLSAVTDNNLGVYFIYKELSDNSINYLKKVNGGAAMKKVTTEDVEPIVADIAVDSKKNVHISYFDANNSNLKYATNRYYNRWATAVIKHLGIVGEYSSMVCDKNDSIHVSYSERALNGDYSLRYYNSIGGDFYQDFIDCSVDLNTTAGEYNSIFVDENGMAGIYYHDYSSGLNIKLARQDINYRWRWSSSTLTIAGDALYPSADYSAVLGESRIAYRDETQRYLKFSTPSSVTSSVDTSGNTGENPSMVIDKDAMAHISYYDNTNSALKYAKQTPTSWIIQTIDSDGLVGSNSSLALDRQYKPNIAYYKGNTKTLKYAYMNNSGIWNIESVDDTTKINTHIALAIDSQNTRHISYIDIDNKTLKYAKKDYSNAIVPIFLYLLQ